MIKKSQNNNHSVYKKTNYIIILNAFISVMLMKHIFKKEGYPSGQNQESKDKTGTSEGHS